MIKSHVLENPKYFFALSTCGYVTQLGSSTNGHLRGEGSNPSDKIALKRSEATRRQRSKGKENQHVTFLVSLSFLFVCIFFFFFSALKINYLLLLMTFKPKNHTVYPRAAALRPVTLSDPYTTALILRWLQRNKGLKNMADLSNDFPLTFRLQNQAILTKL